MLGERSGLLVLSGLFYKIKNERTRREGWRCGSWAERVGVDWRMHLLQKAVFDIFEVVYVSLSSCVDAALFVPSALLTTRRRTLDRRDS